VTIPFITGIFAQPVSSFQKWKDRGFNTLYGYDGEGGKVTKAQWEQAAIAAGMNFISAAGADLASESKQSGRLGWSQPDEPDLVTHVNLPGSRIKDLAATYQACHAAGLPVWMNLNGSAFDNIWYDGTPHPGKTDGSLAGHRAATGGYMAWADYIGFDYYLWTTGRAGMFDITKRLMDRANDWSGGKPIFVFVELCTQGSGKPFTADDFESQVNTVTQYAKDKAYKLAGIVGFADQTIPNWKSYDITPQDVVERAKVVNARLLGKSPQPAPAPAPQPQPADDLAAVKAQLDSHARTLADVMTRQAATDAVIARIRAALSDPTTQPVQP